MADIPGQADIRGIDVDRTVKGFADKLLVMEKYVAVTPTSAREIRWFQKTNGFLTGTTTTGITASTIANVAEKARPALVNQSWTRNTSYVRKYFVESEMISVEDIKDNDVDVLLTTIRDLVLAVQNQVNTRIWDVLTESQTAVNINSVTSNAAWNTASYTGVNIVEDLMDAKKAIFDQGYDPEGAILFLNSLNHKSLITWLIDGKGSSIPQFSSQKVQDGVVMEILGLKVVVSHVVTADKAAVVVPFKDVNTPWACTFKEFMPITSVTITDEGIGKKIRVWREGEAILHDPKAVTLINNTDS